MEDVCVLGSRGECACVCVLGSRGGCVCVCVCWEAEEDVPCVCVVYIYFTHQGGLAE